MNKMPLKVLIISTITMLLGYLALLGYSITAFAPESVDIFFRRNWITNYSLILFSRSFLSLHTAAVVIAFSLFFKPAREQGKPEPFYKLVRFTLIIFLVNTGVFFLLQEMAIPRANNRLIAMEQKTQLAREYKDEAKDWESRGEYAQALDAIERTIVLIPAEYEYQKESMERLSNLISEDSDSYLMESREEMLKDLSPRELLIQAQMFEDQEDLFSAYYYSSLAYRIDPNLGDARAMASRIWDKLTQVTPDKDDIIRRQIFDLKKQGTELLTEGRPVEAYYIFLKAKDFLEDQERPHDVDIETYLSLSRQETMNMAYFLPAAEKTMITPGYDSVFFLNTERQRSEKNPVKEYMAFKRLIADLPQRGSWMAEGVSIIGIAAEGVVYEISAPFAKITPAQRSGPGRIILQGLDPLSERETIYTPMVHKGDPPEYLEGVMPFLLTQDQLKDLSYSSRDIEAQDFFTIWQNRKHLPELGISASYLDREILNRLVHPFTFFIAAILAAAIGWRHRRPGKMPYTAAVILIPALPFIINIVEGIYLVGMTSITGFILMTLGLGMAITITLVVQGLLFILSFIFLAAQNSL